MYMCGDRRWRMPWCGGVRRGGRYRRGRRRTGLSGGNAGRGLHRRIVYMWRNVWMLVLMRVRRVRVMLLLLLLLPIVHVWVEALWRVIVWLLTPLGLHMRRMLRMMLLMVRQRHRSATHPRASRWPGAATPTLCTRKRWAWDLGTPRKWHSITPSIPRPTRRIRPGRSGSSRRLDRGRSRSRSRSRSWWDNDSRNRSATSTLE